MREFHIRISGINLITVLDVEVYKSVNEHGYARVKGIIEDKNEDAFIQKYKKDAFSTVEIWDENAVSQVLFCGVVTGLEVSNDGFSKRIEIEVMGATYLMDCQAKTKSFQDKTMTYDEIVKNIDASYDASGCIPNGGEEAIGDIIVQYKETDWTFVKRLSSHFNQPVVPLWIPGKVVYSFGLLKNGRTVTLNNINYKVNTKRDEYYFNIGNGLDDFTMEDADIYEVTTREYLELGEAVIFHGKRLFVYEVRSNYIGEELLHTYSLKTENGFKLVKKYNMNLIGASLDASILAVQKDTVKIHLSVDASQDVSSAKWFPYSTVYSSVDGTGWYCMPEKGDKVRLYFPNEKEEEGYVISSINVGGAGGGARSNPDNKSISNKYNKQIELTPSSITMTNNAGLVVCLDDEEGISLVSNKQVSITAEEDLVVMSSTGKLDIKASESIVLSQGSSKLTLKDDVTVEGGKFLVQ